MDYNVAVLGASSNPERYSYKAVKLLAEHDYCVFPVHPSKRPIDGIQCYASLGDIGREIDTISVYMSPRNSTPLIDQIIAANPRRVILNPGTENPELRERCQEAGIEVIEACTLVLLNTGQF